MGSGGSRRIGIERVEIGVGRCRLVTAAKHPLNDVVDVGEIPLHAAVVEHLDRIAGHDRSGKEHGGHVGPSPGPVNREEAQARRRQAVKMAVRVRHQLIGFLAGGIETHRVVHRLALIEGEVAVASIDRAAGGVHQVLHTMVTTALEHMTETHQIALDVGGGILE